MYFAAVMDVFNREIVGWALASHQRTELIVEALQNAKHAIRTGETIFHSDQGVGLKQEVMEYVECWYNRQRFHSALGQQSPAEHRERWTNREQSQAAEQRGPDDVARTTDLGPKTDQICSEHITVLSPSSEKRMRKELTLFP